MRERFLRIEAIGLSTAELAERIGTSEDGLARWITGFLSVEEADVIEVGLSLLEMRPRKAADVPTLRLVGFAAA